MKVAGSTFLLTHCMLFYSPVHGAVLELSVLVTRYDLCMIMSCLQFKLLIKASEEAEGKFHN